MLSKRFIAAAALTGVTASLPVIAAGVASAHTVSAAHTAVQVAAVAQTPAVAPAAAPAQAPQAAKAATPQTYTVVSGDWLSKIASSHNVQGGWQKLYDLNKNVLVKGPNLIFPGQKLVLGGAVAQATTPAPAAKPAAPAAPAAPAPKAPAAKPSTTTTSTTAKAVKPAPQASHSSSNVNTAPVAFTGGSLQALAASIVPANQLASFDQIITHESGWNVSATNPSSGAYGLPQALPGNKMASAGSDWRTNPATQIKWALDYMNSRYGSPNQAWAFWQTHHAY